MAAARAPILIALLAAAFAAVAGATPVADDAAARMIALVPGERHAVRIDANSPEAEVDGKRVRYRRVVLPKPLAKARIDVELAVKRHRKSPRFTVLAPQLVILDGGGEIRAVVPVDPLTLDIEPFKPTRLRGCVEVANLAGFLLTTDASRVGELYQFNARTRAGSAPDRGFYNPHTPIRVFIHYADAGRALLTVRAAADDADCQSVSG